MNLKRSLSNIGESVSFMMLSIRKKLGISELKPTRMSLQLADRSIKYPTDKNGTMCFMVEYMEQCVKDLVHRQKLKGVLEYYSFHSKLYVIVNLVCSKLCHLIIE